MYIFLLTLTLSYHGAIFATIEFTNRKRDRYERQIVLDRYVFSDVGIYGVGVYRFHAFVQKRVLPV
jgi:hypothetical protein